MRFTFSNLPAVGWKLGGIHSSAGRAAAMLEKGYRFVAVGFDISFMASAASAAPQAPRPKPLAS